MPPRSPRPSAARAALAPLLGLVLALTTAAAGPFLGTGPARAAAAAAPAALSLTASTGYADTPARLAATLTSAGAPLAGRPVVVQRRVAGTWRAVATATTDVQGRVLVTATRVRRATDNAFRARWAGDASYAAATSRVRTAPLRRRGTEVGLDVPARVVDGRAARLRVTWRTASGLAVPGQVRLQRRDAGRGWRLHRVLGTGSDGVAALTVRPAPGTRWRAVAGDLDWVRGATSPVRTVAVRPPGDPVRLPRGAPRPRITLPAQPAAVGRGANAVITPVPDAVWKRMVGVSWHAGCPVGRSGLRLLRINYWGFDGYRHRGELVAATGAVGSMARALTAMLKAELPIRAMYLVDRFGYSPRLGGADDYRSMAADNTSAFNCRSVVNRPGVRSPHATGRSLDVNPWENPYRSATGYTPNSWWPSRSHPRVAWRSASHPVVRAMSRSGMRWTYGTGDSHHFDAANGAGRVVVPRGCGPVVCH